MIRTKSSSRLLILACVILVAAAVVLFLRNPPAPLTVSPPAVALSTSLEQLPPLPPAALAASAEPQATSATHSPVIPPPESPASKPRQLVVKGVYNPPPLEGPHAAELTRIQDLSVTYDAREVPALAAFLTHDSAEVRAAAIDGLIRLGSKEAAEPLRAAAGKVKDPREAIAMLDAADYLELPPMPASMLRKRKEPKASATPNPATSEHKKTTAVGGG